MIKDTYIQKMGQGTKFLREVCGNCGLSYGSHHAGTAPWPMDYCPGHEGQMDWENGPGTTFKPTGEHKEFEFCPSCGSASSLHAESCVYFEGGQDND